MTLVRKTNTVLILMFLLLCIVIDISLLEKTGLSLNPFSGKFPATIIFLAAFWAASRFKKWEAETSWAEPIAAKLPMLSAEELKEKIKQIREKLPELKWNIKTGETEVLSNSETGFPVSILFEAEFDLKTRKKDPACISESVLDSSIEYTVYYFANHEHFSPGREYEVLRTFLLGLSDAIRLKVISKQGIDYGFFTEIKDKNQNQYALMNRTWFLKPALWKFWFKKEVRYLQNRYLTREEAERMLKELLLEK